MTHSGTDAPPELPPSPAAAAARIRVQVFPLAADRAPLEDLCNEWFNKHVPAEVALFRPAMPFVFCTVLTYEDMGPIQRWKAGVYAQNEIYFLVLLDRYRWNGRGLEFVEHCVTTPYIFVDDATSAIVGRESFGFPKEVCTFSTARPGSSLPWAPDATDYLSVQTWQPTRAGRQLRPLLWISQTPVLADAGFDSAYARPVAARSGAPGRTDLLWWAQAILGEVRARSRPGLLVEAPGAIAEIGRALRDGLSIKAYNLRQIPHPYDLTVATYQDLVGFDMRLRGVQNVRFFRERFGTGAGYSVMINRLETLPIVERLGLRSSDRQRLGDSEGSVVDVIDAISPMYLQADVALATSERLCWRFARSAWHVEGGYIPRTTATDASPRYNDYLGASSAVFLQEQDAPPILDMRYIMLPARTEQIVRHIASMIPRHCPVEIVPLSLGGLTPVRILWSRSRERNAEVTEFLVWMDGSYLSISVPVKYRFMGEEYEALLMIKDFSDNPFTIQLNRAIYGVPTHQGNFPSTTTWFTSSQPVQVHQILETSFLHRGPREARHKVDRLMDVLSDVRTPRPATASSPQLAALRDAFISKVARIRPVLTFGGIPDSSDSTRFVERRMTLAAHSSTISFGPVAAAAERTYWMRVGRTETHRIVSRLGLLAEDPQDFGLPKNDFASMRVDLVPVAAVMESAEHIHLDDVQVLWRRWGVTDDVREDR